MKKLVSVVCGLGLVAGVGLASPALAANTQDAAEGYTYDLLTFETDDPRAEAVFAELDQIMPDWRERLAARQLDNPGEVALLVALNRAINRVTTSAGLRRWTRTSRRSPRTSTSSRS